MGYEREFFVPGVGPVIDRRPSRDYHIGVFGEVECRGKDCPHCRADEDTRVTSRQKVREILSSRGWPVQEADLDEIEGAYRDY